ncbi:acetoacetate decarboxylase [Cytobacillus oceanisediminis]|uniref:Acetoacetate decarboxylase n=1 Tax=Cytobacillus oceanisediminis TaxID=665099 RepID=A0A2V3A4F6_9BACI|nr:acetoacetate decarboxylase family protein [Cytobacillus oceanisediminis]PWW31325.1 acetoacetate decarboxylase [Cytobacillus oceanisediminis]
MKKPYEVQNFWTVPIQAPLVDASCFPPFSCENCKTLTAYFRANPEIIKKYLVPPPFEYVSDIVYAYVSDFTNADPNDGYNQGFYDSGLVIPVKYKGREGVHVLYEYENHDYAIAAGRELWGYPKKYAEASTKEEDGKVIGIVHKNGKDIIRLEMDASKELTRPIAKPALFPHFQIKVDPKPDGPGIDSKKILSRDSSMDFVTKSYVEREIKVELQGIPLNRLDEFQPLEILGGTYTVGDFHCTMENGWAKVEEVLI